MQDDQFFYRSSRYRKMNELMRASSDCAEFDPGMSAKFAAEAEDMGRYFGITSRPVDPLEGVPVVAETELCMTDDEDEFRDLLHLLDLQKKAVAAVEAQSHQKARRSWLGLDVWSRW